MRRNLLAWGVAGFFASVAGVWGEPPQTAAERTEFKETTTLAEAQAFLKALAESSQRVRLSEIGKSGEGRPIPLAILADPAVGSVEEARKSGKLLVLLVGGIHSGECDGKEALLALAREMALGDPSDQGAAALLRNLVVAVVPVYNPDGNEHAGDSAKLRPGQAGPGRLGTRENAAGLDLNRDFVKLEAPETRALVGFISEWDPAVVIDTHTTNGSLHRYLLTYDGPKNPAGDAPLIEYVRDSLLPSITDRARERGKFETFWYGNFEKDHTRWETYPDGPRYGINYVGMRNRVGILTESYSYAGFAERVRGQEEFVRACLERASAEREKIRRLEREADQRAEQEPAADKPPQVAVRSKLGAAPEKVKVLGFEEEQRDGHAVAKGEKDYEVELWTRFEAEKSVPRPAGYLYPASLTTVTENLQRHGVRVEETREEIELDVGVYTVEGLSRAKPFQGHELATVRAAKKERSQRFPAGMMLVSTRQPLGSLAAFLLEPESSDGLATWNFFDEGLKEGAEYPVVRLEKPIPITTSPLRPPAEKGEPQRKLTFAEAYESDRPVRLNGDPIGGLTWLEDGEHFVQVKDGKPWKVNAATGRAEPLQDSKKIAAALQRVPGLDRRTIDSVSSRSGPRTDKARKVAVFEHQNDLYFVRLDGSAAGRLTSSPEREEMATLSPDGAYVAYVRDNDLWVADLAAKTERALTTGGTDRVRNGKNDWVYFEEVFNRSWQAFWWSPDSKRLAFLRIDDTPVKTFPLVNDPARGEPRVEATPFPKPGEPNPRVKLLTVEAAGGEPREVDLSAYTAEDMLITGVGWWPDSSRVYAYVQDRVQTWLDLVRAPADGGEAEKLLRETTKAWVDAPPPLKFLRDGSFLLMSERTGWKHVYRYSRDGKLAGPVTEGEWEARSIAHVDESAGVVFVTGTLDSSIAENLYSVPLEGGWATRLTKDRGGHSVQVSPNGKYFADSWSSLDDPPRSAVFDARDGSRVRVLDTNPVRDLARYQLAQPELTKITTPDGFTLEAMVMRPREFDAARSYPVWFMTYGGPHAPTVSDTWGGGRVWDQVLAASGIVVFRADPRSASGKGAVSAWECYKRLGVSELADIETAVKWMGSQAGIDAGRIGMSGHSYGGFMTSYCLTHSDLFAAGLAGAPVTDWRDYDSIYTERFMLTPQENAEGYKETSVAGAAAGLHGRLLLIHGLIDDNVHFQNSSRLVRALQGAGKQFELMVYPDSRHGVGGRHYQRLQYDFITRALRVDTGTPEPEKPGQGASGRKRPERAGP